MCTSLFLLSSTQGWGRSRGRGRGLFFYIYLSCLFLSFNPNSVFSQFASAVCRYNISRHKENKKNVVELSHEHFTREACVSASKAISMPKLSFKNLKLLLNWSDTGAGQKLDNILHFDKLSPGDERTGQVSILSRYGGVFKYSQTSGCNHLSSANLSILGDQFSKIPKVSRSNHYI